MAQDYAEECNFAHNPHRSNKTQLFSYIGENIAITNNPLVNYTDLVYGWYNENKFYDIVKTKCMGYRECRHYTQVCIVCVYIYIYTYWYIQIQPLYVYTPHAW